MAETRRPSNIGLSEIIGAAGLGLLVYGVWLVFQPAAFIVGGGLLVALAVMRARRV